MKKGDIQPTFGVGSSGGRIGYVQYKLYTGNQSVTGCLSSLPGTRTDPVPGRVLPAHRSTSVGTQSQPNHQLTRLPAAASAPASSNGIASLIGINGRLLIHWHRLLAGLLARSPRLLSNLANSFDFRRYAVAAKPPTGTNSVYSHLLARSPRLLSNLASSIGDRV
ncbi:uncharacterized protein PGTG_20967 [Puccinia graminis f. sp. tritici CRL 75-36-700-3]|uniref:Uncharacterized protein n=1 Tax=Puccinia graminis f. sp. tritici (strain CRL 75-36-700-3 / race SCCL) TaxID=418459 RepID=H6QQ21_PUCGT|nr:uncharacterized protein PGTG_20967 [Puccinia graminis f. sp. tritici CRL 75-36-700-3]EHS64504.1 hypothetical protein PGTG_20967 [Puccinia graminis f. sp. tritici CRL 75-36-700-3]